LKINKGNGVEESSKMTTPPHGVDEERMMLSAVSFFR